MLESFNVYEFQVEAEVSRLEHLKSSKMKELILNKRTELEEICSRIHVVSEAYIPIDHSIEAVESGKILLGLFVKKTTTRKLLCYSFQEKGIHNRWILNFPRHQFFFCDVCWCITRYVNWSDLVLMASQITLKHV